MIEFFKNILTTIFVWEARRVLAKYQPKVVVVNGSVGKTSTVIAIESVLKTNYTVRRSLDDTNDVLGIALTVLGLKRHNKNPILWLLQIIEGFFLSLYTITFPQWLIIEVGAYRPGVLEKISKWLSADMVVMTRLGKIPSSIEYFLSTEELLKEKKHIASSLKKEGVLIINGDDKDLMTLADVGNDKLLVFGTSPRQAVHISTEEIVYGPLENSEIEFPIGVRCTINYGGGNYAVTVQGALGQHHIYPILAAFSVGVSLSMSPLTVAQALGSYQPPRGRLRIIPGIKNTLILDDSYSSSPVGCEQALATLLHVRALGRKIVIFGDMLHLGKQSIEAHKYIGGLIKGVATLLVTVGVRARAIAEGALDAGLPEGAILQFENVDEVGLLLANAVKTGDVILVKGGNLMRMEKIVESLMQHPDHASELLVRQHLK